MIAAIYTRVSREEQTEGYSLEAQEEACRRLCEYKGWQLAELYTDPGISAKDDNRPAFQRMIADVEAGRVGVVVVHKLDRYSRSLLDTLTYLKLLKDNDCGLISCLEGDFDFTTPQGWLFLSFLAIFAEWYLHNLSQEVKKGKQQRAQRGQYNGRLTYGYTTPRWLRAKLATANDAERALIEQALEQYSGVPETAAMPCPFTAPILIWIFEQYVYHKKVMQTICDELNAKGIRTNSGQPWAHTTLSNMIRSRFYIGEMRHHGRWIPGAHEPLISLALWQQAQARRVESKRGDSDNRPWRVYPLSSILHCGSCGSVFTGHPVNGVRRYADAARRHADVYCERKPNSIDAETLEQQVKDILVALALQMPDDWQERLTQRLQAGDQQQDMAAQRRRVEGQLSRAKQLYILGDIDEQTYFDTRTKLRAKLDALQPIDANSMLKNIDDVGQIVYNISDVLANADLQDLNTLCQHLLTSAIVNGADVTAIEPTPVLWSLISTIWPDASCPGITVNETNVVKMIS